MKLPNFVMALPVKMEIIIPPPSGAMMQRAMRQALPQVVRFVRFVFFALLGIYKLLFLLCLFYFIIFDYFVTVVCYNEVMVKAKARKKTGKVNGGRRVSGRHIGARLRKIKYGETYQSYLSGKLKLKTYQKVGVGLLVVVLAGFVGWVWEFMLQEISGGFRYLYIKGGNLLPWINLYAYGALAIMLVTNKLRRYPWAVFVVSAVVCGALELFAGWIVYVVGNGTRYWDYSNKWWGVGDINGFVCPVSAIVFGVAALLFVYGLLPFCIYVARKMSRKAFLTLTITLFALVMIDDITNLTLKNLGLPTAMNFYEWLGWKYK